MKVKLGDKVKCQGFLKKTGYSIGLDRDEWGQVQEVSTNDPSVAIDFEEGVLVTIKKYEQKDFIGFVCGKKRVAETIYYDTSEYGGVHICKRDFTDCYEVCVENKNKSWGKRLVPIDKIELVDRTEEAQWVGIDYDGYADEQPVWDTFECSNCKEEYYSDDGITLPNYCPNCGRKMVKEKKDE